MGDKDYRYNVVLPQGLFDLMQEEADKHGVTVAHFLRQSIKLGLIIDEANNNPNKEIIIREGDKEHSILII
jgi:hypothetical protein